MRKNGLGDRMKEYERTSDAKLVRRLPMIVRLDGGAAGNVLAERLQLEQPRLG